MDKSLGLYIHIPFCKSKCPYCDFFSSKADEIALEEYTIILINKIKLWSMKIPENISTIYVGGGTPSILGAERLCRILKSVKDNFNVLNNAEITVEVNPDTGKNINFNYLYSAGYNRLSIGMQSSVEAELKSLGRIHTPEDASLTVQHAKNSGFNNISLDLMIGIPHQTAQSLEQSIKFCFDCGVTHISSYILKIEAETKFDKIKDKLIFPDDDEQAKLYLYAVDLLEKSGYKQYEISNFAKKGYESKHNINYWNCGEYIGIGPSAHSFYRGKRFYYNRNTKDFENNKTVFDCFGGTEEEFIMLSLRLKSGLQFDEYRKRFGKELPRFITDKVKKYAKLGFMQMDEKKINFTPKGYLVSNTIISELI